MNLLFMFSSAKLRKYIVKREDNYGKINELIFFFRKRLIISNIFSNFELVKYKQSTKGELKLWQKEKQLSATFILSVQTFGLSVLQQCFIVQKLMRIM